jgi:hypothetical protein
MGLADHVTFEAAEARALPEGMFDFVTMFHYPRDMGDPKGAAA